MTNVIVGNSFDVSQTQREHGLSTIKRLYLALLVYAQHHSFIRGIQIEPHNISHFLNKEGVGRELKMALTMRLETKSSPDPIHGGTRQLSVLGHCPYSPMSSIMRFGFEGLTDKYGNFFI